MSQTISFVNNTSSQIKIYGMAVNALTGCQNAVDCANGSYVINPGMGLATLNSADLPLFQLSAPDFVFDVVLSTASTSPNSLPSDALGGANQVNYAGIILLNAGNYTVFIQDLTNIKTVKFVNNTQEAITIQNIQGNPLDQAALVFPKGSYPISANTTATATIGDLQFFETFQLKANDYAFNVVLGINSIMPDLDPPSNQAQYLAGLSYSENEYVITVSPLSTNNMVFENQTSDQITIQSIGVWGVSSPFTNLTDSVVQTPNQGYVINPGTGSAQADSSITQFTLTCADFAFGVNLSNSGTIFLPQLGGVNQSAYAASILKNGSQYTIVIAPNPSVPTVQFINNTQETVSIAKELNDPNAFTNCLNNLICTSESYQLYPGEGTCQIGDLQVNHGFTLKATDFTFTIALNSPGPILASGYVGLVSQIGNLYTVVIEKGSSGSGTVVSFPFTGSVAETLFSQSLQNTDYNTISIMQRKPMAVSVSLKGDHIEATLTSCGCSWACKNTTPLCTTCDLLNVNKPSLFSLCVTSAYNHKPVFGDFFLQINSDPESVIVSSQAQTSLTSRQFLFPLNSTGTVNVVLSNSATSTFTMEQPLKLGANYSFNSANGGGGLQKYNVGNISSDGSFSFMFASTIPNTINNNMPVSGVITIQDALGVPVTFTITKGSQSSLTGSASFGEISNVSFTGELSLGSGEVIISISGKITVDLPQFSYNDSLVGSVSLTFYE
jgi:hypothetical protein